MARKVSEYCALLHKTTQPAPYGTGCVMKTLSCCLREAIFLLPPTPGTKTDQRHKPCPEENHRRRQRNHCHGRDYSRNRLLPGSNTRRHRFLLVKELILGEVVGSASLLNDTLKAHEVESQIGSGTGFQHGASGRNHSHIKLILTR